MKQGVSLLFALSDAPVIPCVILGSDRLCNPRSWLPWRRPGIWISYGKPILPLRHLAGEEEGFPQAIRVGNRKIEGAPLRGLQPDGSRSATPSAPPRERAINPIVQP